jgi:hypothetical protein
MSNELCVGSQSSSTTEPMVGDAYVGVGEVARARHNESERS